MSEIRDKVKERIKDYVWGGSNAEAEATANKILSIPEIAIVDREAKLPEKEFASANENYRYKEAQQDILKAGWVKEEK